MSKSRTLLLVSAGGALGALARYLFIMMFPQEEGQFPVTIFAENITGAFLLAYLMSSVNDRFTALRPWLPLFSTGFLGSFTTFSNYALDIVLLAGEEPAATGFIYMAGSIFAGLFAAVLGWAMGAQKK